MDFTIRKAALSDIDQVVDFTSSTFPWGDYVPRAIYEWVKAGTAYVAVRDNEVLGVLNMVNMGNDTVWLEGLRIKPNYRRMGIGRALTMYAISEAKATGARYVMLMIAEWNNPSRNLAESMGFRGVLTLHAGVAEPSSVRVVKGNEALNYINDALRLTGGYFCTLANHWSCTRANAEYVSSMVNEVYVGQGIGLSQFSVGPPTTPIESEVLATEPGAFRDYYGKYTVYELTLG
ncbi:MAG: GNAT family N-acetyltransferase [Caldivirga sp.]|uniref:GNAT family N-acetyltransferase n=1 Tax=Caldivirga sp. TaxID=2080243 RepID=UPI003D12B826